MSVNVDWREVEKRRMQQEEDRAQQRLRSLALVFAKTNRILSSDPKVTVSIIDGTKTLEGKFNHYPGFTIYPDIYLNWRHFGNLGDKETLVQLLGLNYHELSHVLFSPRGFKKRYLQDRRLAYAYNVLEDQRIESLFTALYEPAGKYFTALIIHKFVKEPHTWESAFLWTYGRSYLPLEIRDEFEQRFALQGLLNDAKALINQYKSFGSWDFEDDSRRFDILTCIREFSEVLKQLQQATQQKEPDDDCGSSDPGDDIDSAPQVAKERESKEIEQERRDREEDTGEDQSGFWDEEEEGEGDDDEYEDDDGEDAAGEEGGEDDSDGESQEPGDDAGDSSAGDDDGTDLRDGEGAEGTGGDDGDSDSDSPQRGEVEDSEGGTDGEEVLLDEEDLKEYLHDILDAVAEDEAVVNEIDRINRTMNDRNIIDVISFGKEGYEKQEVGVEAAREVKQITREYLRLHAEVEPGWKYGSDIGKLNIGRAIQDPDNYDEMFDEWHEGREQDTGLEVFIALDLSTSMFSSDLIGPACEALWIVKRPLDEVGAKTTVVGFHSSTVGLYSRDEVLPRGEWHLFTDLAGATLPAESMHLGRRVLQQSPMPNKVFIIITDGAWQNKNPATGKPEDLAENIKSIPGVKMYIGLGKSRRNEENFKHFDVAIQMEDPAGITKATKQLVTRILNIQGRR